MNEAIRDWVTNVRTTYYCIGSAAGPHPYPLMVRELQKVIGEEIALQSLEAEGRLCAPHQEQLAPRPFPQPRYELIPGWHLVAVDQEDLVSRPQPQRRGLHRVHHDPAGLGRRLEPQRLEGLDLPGHAQPPQTHHQHGEREGERQSKSVRPRHGETTLIHDRIKHFLCHGNGILNPL